MIRRPSGAVQAPVCFSSQMSFTKEQTACCSFVQQLQVNAPLLKVLTAAPAPVYPGFLLEHGIDVGVACKAAGTQKSAVAASQLLWPEKYVRAPIRPTRLS